MLAETLWIMMERMDTTLLTIEETAERLRCSRQHIYRLIRAGALRSVDISSPDAVQRSKMRVRSDDLQNYIDAGSWDAKVHS